MVQANAEATFYSPAPLPAECIGLFIEFGKKTELDFNPTFVAETLDQCNSFVRTTVWAFRIEYSEIASKITLIYRISSPRGR
jgi:hypothetical protein